LAELIAARPSFAALQETKLPVLEPLKLKSFLPHRLSNCVSCHSNGASGGILTAWDASLCSLDSSIQKPFSLTTVFSLAADGTEFAMTNVYAPTHHSEKAAFISELTDLAAHIAIPWILVGDFNLTRCPADKNNGNFNLVEAALFNGMINDLCLIEIPLVDRAFTWSNKRDNPILVRLDRCLVNVSWDEVFS
jgi:hypothetical protein